jgi:hypothetical protein
MIKEFILETFNNREIVLFIYLLIFLIWIFTQKQIRISIFNLLKALTNKQILISILVFLMYIALLVLGLYYFKFWDLTLLKDTIYWTFGVGFVILMNSNKADEEDRYFRNLLKDNLKLTIVLEFILGLYVFGFFTELILAPIVIIFSIFLGFFETSTEYNKPKNVLQFIFGIAGFLYLIFSIYKIILDFKEFASFATLKSFLFPIIMLILFLPYGYLYALFIQYESIYTRLGFSLKDDKVLRKYAKRRILTTAKFSMVKLKKIAPGFLFYECKTKEDIDQEINKKIAMK